MRTELRRIEADDDSKREIYRIAPMNYGCFRTPMEQDVLRVTWPQRDLAGMTELPVGAALRVGSRIFTHATRFINDPQPGTSAITHQVFARHVRTTIENVVDATSTWCYQVQSIEFRFTRLGKRRLGAAKFSQSERAEHCAFFEIIWLPRLRFYTGVRLEQFARTVDIPELGGIVMLGWGNWARVTYWAENHDDPTWITRRELVSPNWVGTHSVTCMIITYDTPSLELK